MGTIFFILLCWYFVKGRDDPNVHNAAKKAAGGTAKAAGGCFTVIFILIGLTIVSTAFGILSAFSWLIPFIFVFAVISAISKSGKEKKQREKSPEYRDVVQNYNQGEEFKLTKSTDKRIRIISRFSKKHNLALNDDQIELIMNASYVSYHWEKEVYDMSKSYSVEAEWFKSETDWLRAYLKVFPIMDISSDFLIQKKIVKDSFLEIFRNLPTGSYYTTNELIKWINNKYMVNFDEMSFRIAHRFLEECGYSFKLPTTHILRNDSEIDKLAEAYDRMEGSAGKPGVM